MNFIEEYYNSLNVYYSLIIYDKDPPHHLISTLKSNDYPVILISKFDDLEIVEMNHRMFVLHIDAFKELLFIKQNDIHQYTVIFCLNDTIDDVERILLEEQPKCVESVLITKI